MGHSLEEKCRTVNKQTNSGGWTFQSEYFEGRFFKKGTVHLKWKRDDLWERFNLTAAAGKKWLGEDTQQYRPKKRREEPEWYCEHNGHKFVDGTCTNCGDPEIDEVALIECDYCRVIFEHTGRKQCPIHEELPPALMSNNPDATDPEESLRELWNAQGVPQTRQDEIIADIVAKAQPGAMIGPFVLR